jgi:hypothetical protein
MRRIKFPLGPQGRARDRALAMAHEWQDCERRAAFARIASLAETVRDWDPDAVQESQPAPHPCAETLRRKDTVMPQSTPTPTDVGQRAADILALIKNTEEYDRLERSSQSYTDCWATFTGYALIAEWSQATDAGPLFEEALRVLALKTAVFELSGGDEHLAELEISAPVDEMVHAVLAQYTLCQTMTARLGIKFVHMTDQERFNYQAGGYTDQCYATAGWGEQDRRYWLDRDEMGRRLNYLGALYSSIGFQEEGRSHTHDFKHSAEIEDPAVAAAV